MVEEEILLIDKLLKGKEFENNNKKNCTARIATS